MLQSSNYHHHQPHQANNDVDLSTLDSDDHKTRCFNLFPSIFRRQYFRHSKSDKKLTSNGEDDGDDDDDDVDDGDTDEEVCGYLNDSFIKHTNYQKSERSHIDPTPATFPFNEKCLIPGSPISPRVKNFNLDMRILVLSRNDNPYLSKQIQRSNSLASSDFDHDYFVQPTTPIVARKNRINSFNFISNGGSSSSSSHGLNLLQPEDQKNLHEQLIRSPPPNFPEKLSHFLINEDLIAERFND
ncbi:hypothetical protein QR98_0010470 [Sarcoptes scabiei]|uniref:Uncharacterized protein n=1 Tax=Sarcoptes scabiei TaxID=52283 RepID=A0A131ZVI3_SARSC|nr:hypothetical protein QR98_0010470 [Sarcoptes scabiei]